VVLRLSNRIDLADLDHLMRRLSPKTCFGGLKRDETDLKNALAKEKDFANNRFKMRSSNWSMSKTEAELANYLWKTR